MKDISDTHGRLDGLIAAAGIQQETSALEYTQKDANTMFEVSSNESGLENVGSSLVESRKRKWSNHK